MTRKEIYDQMEGPHTKVYFLLGALLYDEVTDRGVRPLTAAKVEKLDGTELAALNVFVLELIAAESGPLPENLKGALNAIGSELAQRRPNLVPSPRGKDCPGNGEHEGIECKCDECDYMMVCYPDFQEPLK